MGGKGKGKGPSKSKGKTEVLEATTPHGDSDATLSSHPNLNLALTPTYPTPFRSAFQRFRSTGTDSGKSASLETFFSRKRPKGGQAGSSSTPLQLSSDDE